jgi:hypothetical protein
VDVKRLTEHSVILSDGTELPADPVVYAAGYGSMNGWAADLISTEVANKVGKVWGLGDHNASGRVLQRGSQLGDDPVARQYSTRWRDPSPIGQRVDPSAATMAAGAYKFWQRFR